MPNETPSPRGFGTGGSWVVEEPSGVAGADGGMEKERPKSGNDGSSAIGAAGAGAGEGSALPVSAAMRAKGLTAGS